VSRTNHHGEKKKQRLFNPWFWFEQTPAWWIRMMMQKPQRRKASMWQRDAEKSSKADLDNLDKPPHGKKPHWYFW